MAKCLGPDIPLVDGASIVGQFYTLGHYNDVTVRLVTDFAPKTLVLDLKPARTGSSYPKATVSISSKGDPEQKELGEIVLKKEAVEEYKLEGLAAGEYYVRIHYGATEPEGTARPALLIKSVELKK